MAEEKVHIEFTIKSGTRDMFLAALQILDTDDKLSGCIGFRADDQVQRREALAKFVDTMELILRRHDDKRTWRDKPITALISLLMLEVEEFKVADQHFTVEEARHELIDMANFCLICWDRLGMLDRDRNRHEQERMK